ncbi:SCO-spondin [Triplophysa rosa]|uniref:SCO-spondin n=1 Tax=Triplophysa rosa TaxID=992332 RepID=A0A9W7T9B1_TRIRA|nr:SCO-spondin [Triplophysa rosa]
MKIFLAYLVGLRLIMVKGHWCEHAVEEKMERIISPRLQLEVKCSEVYQYNTRGWRLDVDRMRHEHGGDDGIALYYKRQGPKAFCYLFKPPDIETDTVNRTVRQCCEGWSGPHCSEGVGFRGQCFSTWTCEEFPGVQNSSLMALEECCSKLWGLSWRNASDGTCLTCTYTLLSDFRSPVTRGGLFRGVRDPQASGTCMSWGGAHYRTFDRKHFHFQGTCTYLLASSTDGTWTVYITSVCDSSGVSVHWLGDFVFVESGLGVRLKFDMENNVYLTVTAEHQTATRGLCGVFNNNPDDDFTTSAGSVSPYAASFGNSWRVQDQQTQVCNDAAELGHSCDVTADVSLRHNAETVCHRLKESPFTHCHQQVDPGPYIDTCLYLYCSLSASERDAAVCDTLAGYVRECAQQHVIISWRKSGFCERTCPSGQVFSDCVSSCPPSCSSRLPPASGQCRDECVGGCECPQGLYLHAGQCWRRDDCPCFYRRRTYGTGDTITQKCNTCVCRAGQWECSGERCEAQCTVTGGMHITTFDQKRYDLQGGDCRFTAVEDFVDKKLSVSISGGSCAGGGADGCLRELTVTALHTTVIITDTGSVMVNGQREMLPLITGDLMVRKASSSFLVIQAFGAELMWYLDGPMLFITLQPGFAHKVRGLCGTLTWTQHDDFATPEGDVENGVTSFAGKFSTGSCPLPSAGTSDPCGTYTQRRQYAESVCSVIHSAAFQACHDVVDRESYLRLCLSEVCSCGPLKSCQCTVLAAYARHCAQEGAPVSWRNRTFCSVQCSGGQVYQECGRPCGASCSDLWRGWSCEEGIRSCVPGCQCPEGLAQDGEGQCVPVNMCPCMQGDKLHPAGSTIQKNCNSCVCTRGMWTCTDDSCPEVSQCPGSLIFSPHSCLRTCSGPHPPLDICTEPMHGCVCPEGTVLLGDDQCVTPDECPCHHNGKLYFTNDTISKDCNTCVCRGQRWHCGQLLCAGTCVATGDPHYITFDGRYFSFLGDCEYVLAQETSGLFGVTAENVPCGSTGVTCTKSVTLTVGNTAIHLLRGKAVTVNGIPVTLPKSYSGSGLILERVGMFVSLTSRLGVSLLWDGGMRVYVRLMPHLSGRMGGLCGNFDGDAENDFTTRQGIMESTPELFGNSWKVSPSCPDVTDQDLRDPCIINPHRVTWAKKKCAVIGQEIFSPCHAEVPFQKYYDWCVFDACGCDSGGDCECLCTAIAAYAEACNRRGVYIRWRSQELCPLQCENGLVYEACGPACSPECPSAPSNPETLCGALSCVEGCFCPHGTVRHGDGCISVSQCPCEWDGSLYPAGASLVQHCQNCSCSDGSWHCVGSPCSPPSPCEDSEFLCPGGSQRCIPSLWLCDNEDDCGDGSDEICPSTCAPGHFRCSGGACLPLELRCNGHPDCADQSDEDFCAPASPVPVCPAGEFMCSNGRCLPVRKVCDGKLDCGFADDSDEHDCGVLCRQDEFRCSLGRCVLYLHRCDGHDDCGDYKFQCPEDQCVPADRVCDGRRDCLSGIDELICPFKGCSQFEFGCTSGQCVPLAWRCDSETDCLDGTDEKHCSRTCQPDQFLCHTGDQCIQHQQLCDGTPDCKDASDESVDNCGSTWIPPCPGSFSCDNRTCVNVSRVCNGIPDCPRGEDEILCAGVMSRQRRCTPEDSDVSCRGESVQRQQCYSTACPVDGYWLPWVTWSNCSAGCEGVEVRQRECFPPQNGGRTCTELPGETNLTTDIRPCPPNGCVNVSCPAGLVRHTCASCPLTCAHVSRATTCDPNSKCFTGCWCADGRVMNHERQCVLPDECVCEVSGVRYWPGQQVKVGCDICVCERGQAQRCQPNPECSVHCGWSSWSSWGECLGPCGVQSVQWSFRSPNNPSKHGNGRQCRGIYRKARRCQTEACSECEYEGHTHAVGERWRGSHCQLCHCLPNLTVRCAPFCPYTATGCPQGWSPEPEQYRDLSPGAPEGHVITTHAPYLQMDLLRPYNITGVLTQGGGVFDTFVSSFYLQFSSDGHQWYMYKELITDARPKAKVFLGNSDDHGVALARLDRMVSARFVRILPHDFQNGIYLRVELVGCAEEHHGSTPAPPLTVSPPLRPCREREFLCGNGRCVPAGPQGALCDGLDDCGDATDELNCGICSSPLGLEEGRVHYGQLTSSSYRENNPADAGRLNVVPNVMIMEPGWSPLPGDPHPFFQVDFLEPTWISGVVTQGSERMWGYLTKYRLAFALEDNHFTNFTETGEKGSPPKMFEVRMVGRTPVTRWLERLVKARYLRIIPEEFRNTFYLRVEVLGCRGVSTVTPGVPGLQNRTGPTGSPGLWDTPTPPDDGLPRVLCVEGQFVCRSFGCVEAALVCDGRKDCPDGSDEERCGAVTPVPSPITPTQRPRVPKPCSVKQFSCWSGECVSLGKRCDLRRDCADGSDEQDCFDCILSPWSSWSQCSASCGLGSLFRQRSILRDARPGGSCGGAQFDSRACFLQACPVDGLWSEWSEWSGCDVPCGGGLSVRNRTCSNPPPKNGGKECEGMSRQTHGCNACGPETDTHTGCTGGMILVKESDCLAGRMDPCPVTCSDLQDETSCTLNCTTGCRCPPGLLLQAGRCVNISECECSWEGSVLRPGEEVHNNSCSTCVCKEGRVTCDKSSCVARCDWSAWSLWTSCDSVCGTGIQHLNGGWSSWSSWSDCSSACDSGVQTRDRFCSAPPPLYAGLGCPGPHIQTRDCNVQPCTGVCPDGMSFLLKEQCQAQGGACPRVCLDAMLDVECATECYDGCYCSPGHYLYNNTCVPLEHCPCYHKGALYMPGDTVSFHHCNNCTCVNGEMACGSTPCPVDCGWSEWTSWSACSRTCDVGIRRRFRSGTSPAPALGGRACEGERIGLDTCSITPCFGVKGTWSPWSECSVPCGGGYRNRTRGPIRTHGTSQQFSACNLQPCGSGSVCAAGQEWSECVRDVLLCSDLGTDIQRDATCHPGCQCPDGSALQDLDGNWSSWTPWGLCSVSLWHWSSVSLSVHRSDPERVGNGLPCVGPDREDRVCDGGWSEWTFWTDCSKFMWWRCEETDETIVEGLGTELITCNTNHCPVAPCSHVPGSVFSACGPSCPRSCDDLTYCEWRCEPGCYCTDGKVLNSNGSECVERESCHCLDMLTGRRVKPGEMVPAPDGCNNCTCDGGKLICSENSCPVDGGWCEWSDWTPCSKTCGVEWVTRYRSCACPEPRSGGASCPDQQEEHAGLGVQIQRQPCPSVTFCSDCDACEGVSVRQRVCNSPPARFGGLPCHGESRQTHGCHDNITVCTDCGGGQEFWPCGKPCPRSCSDLHGDTECVDALGCSPSCGCPGDMMLQDGVCVERDLCRCKYHNSSTFVLDAANVSWSWSGTSDWQQANPGEAVITDCNNCTCDAGVLQCESLPGCFVDGGWSQWAPWSECSAPCGGGVRMRLRSQRRSRVCRTPPCSGMKRQSKTCNTQVCLEVGCPPGRLYRECDAGDGCPFSCSQVSGHEGCYSEGCDEGCHCPLNTYQHNGTCVHECPCLVDSEFLASLQGVSVTPELTPDLQNITEGTELMSGEELMHECSSCSCEHGLWNCSLVPCPRDGGLSPWGPWGPCSLSCGGLGQKSRSRRCDQPTPAHGGRDCDGPLLDTAYCQTPDCPVVSVPTEEPSLPDEDMGFSQWSAWSQCSRTCSDSSSPALKFRTRECVRELCSGETRQDRVCNLPQCPDGGMCEGLDCVDRNCSWTEWAEWTPCSRSCGVGQHQRVRTFLAPGINGTWCQDIIGGNVENRFCNIRACRVDGGWSRWSSWSRCGKSCGGGRSIRTRSCSSPPPKNGGRKCTGEKNQVKPCNTRPCDDHGCPPGQDFVSCANECPQRCSDLQQGIQCQGSSECQPGCRCPHGQLLQDGVCVLLWQCDCLDASGQSWVAGSMHQVGCNNCSCADGTLTCTNRTCAGESTCTWSSWSNWASCSSTCGPGRRTRFRSLVPESADVDCQFEEVQHKACDPGPCPPLCVRNGQEGSVGDTWIDGECKQCTCIPEGDYCQDIDCRVDGGWTPWSVWSDCPVTCGKGKQIQTRACINPPPRNNGTYCTGPERDTQDCHAGPCLDDVCPWSAWSLCSRSCGAGVISRHRQCVCEDDGDHACPPGVDTDREETQLCYKRPCPDCVMSEWSEWSMCSCVSQYQQRYRAPLISASGGQHCTDLERQSRPCTPENCQDCEEPFVFSECGSACEKHCDLLGETDSCVDCTPGCFCPEGVLQQNGSCVRPDQCGCVHLLHQGSDRPVPVTVPQGALLTEGCRTCVCRDGSLQCASRECEVMVSEWSEWTSCSPCIPASSSLSGGMGSGLVSVQRRFRACLDVESGLPVSGREGDCEEDLEEERLCPQPDVCADVCHWSLWSIWSVCQDPCSGGFRQRERRPLTSDPAPHCRNLQMQSQSCNTGLCPGENCEDRGRVYDDSCANRCPRSCADLWDHVQCLQGRCHAGCRCADGRLLQDGSCLRVDECRCGVLAENGTLEIQPGQNVTIDCNSCSCVNGSLECSDRVCPVYGPWGAWSECSVSCESGLRMRSRTCKPVAGGEACEETFQNQTCSLPPCPAGCVMSDWSSWTDCSASCGGGVSLRRKTILQEPERGGSTCPGPLEQHIACNTNSCLPDCPAGQEFSLCAGLCPYGCEDLWPENQCVSVTCGPGCVCPTGSVMLNGTCVPPSECPCSRLSLLLAFPNMTLDVQEHHVPPGSFIPHLCNSCVCDGGVFTCSNVSCDVDCEWSSWSAWSSCSASCGSGHQFSSRTVQREHQYGGWECEGPSSRTQTCRGPECECPEGERWLWAVTGLERVCERGCLDMYGPEPLNCRSRGASEGCVCEEGLYRSPDGRCVIPALCQCEDHDGTLREYKHAVKD